MIRRSGHFLLRLCAGLAAGLVVLGALLAWRLERGPVAVDFLAPSLAAALGGGERGVALTVDHASLGLARGAKLELIAHGVHVSQRGGASLSLPELAVDLSLRALLRGVIAPARIVLDEPSLKLLRDKDGAFHVGFGSDDPMGSEDWVGRLLHDLGGPLDPKVPFGELAELAVRRARLVVDDRSLGVTWRADDADILLRRNVDGVSGSFDLEVAVGAQATRLDGILRYRREKPQLTAKLDFAGIKPAAWANAAPALAPLAVLDLPVSGALSATLDPARMVIAGAAVDLAFGRGSLRHPGLQNGALAVAGGSAVAAYDAAAGRITIKRFALDLGGPRVEASGAVTGLGSGLLAGALPQSLTASLTLGLSALPMADVPQLWPARLAPITRKWVVEHAREGEIDQIAAKISGHLDLTGTAPKPLLVDHLAGTLAYSGIAIDYFKPLPPARDIDGSAVFDRSTLTFTPTGGRLEGIKVTGGTVRLYQLDTNDEQLALNLTAQGPLQDALLVLDHEPLHYARALAIDPHTVAGRFTADLKFGFPLVHDLTLDQVDFGAAATLDGVAVDNVLFGRKLEDGKLKMQLDRKAMRLSGSAALAGVPVSLEWVENFDATDKTRTRYRVKGVVDDPARARLGLDFFPDRLQGAVGVDFTYALDRAHRGEATVALDLGPANLALAKLGWKKPAGVPATARLDLAFADEHLIAIRDAVVAGGGMDAELTARFDDKTDGGGLSALELKRLITGDTNVSGAVERQAAGGWHITLAGPSFDAAGLVDALQKAPPQTDAPPLLIEAKLGRLVIGKGRMALDLSGRLQSDGAHWQAADLDAAMPGGGKLTLRFGGALGERKFVLSTDDFGALMRLIDLTDNLRGGKFRLTGTAVDEGARRVLKGHVEGEDYRLVGAPLFARLLSAASLSGMDALLSGKGIPFSRLTADVTYGGGKLAFDNLRAYGGAIGVNAHGGFDEGAGTIDVAGTLVPAYRLNSVLGNVPVLGDLLLGGEGQGIFAANFSVVGTLAAPNVSVNLLSALAPGVLRKLFLFAPEGPSPTPEAAPKL